jgi:hypothetical protein
VRRGGPSHQERLVDELVGPTPQAATAVDRERRRQVAAEVVDQPHAPRQSRRQGVGTGRRLVEADQRPVPVSDQLSRLALHPEDLVAPVVWAEAVDRGEDQLGVAVGQQARPPSGDEATQLSRAVHRARVGGQRAAQGVGGLPMLLEPPGGIDPRGGCVRGRRPGGAVTGAGATTREDVPDERVEREPFLGRTGRGDDEPAPDEARERGAGAGRPDRGGQVRREAVERRQPAEQLPHLGRLLRAPDRRDRGRARPTWCRLPTG